MGSKLAVWFFALSLAAVSTACGSSSGSPTDALDASDAAPTDVTGSEQNGLDGGDRSEVGDANADSAQPCADGGTFRCIPGSCTNDFGVVWAVCSNGNWVCPPGSVDPATCG